MDVDPPPPPATSTPPSAPSTPSPSPSTGVISTALQLVGGTGVFQRGKRNFASITRDNPPVASPQEATDPDERGRHRPSGSRRRLDLVEIDDGATRVRIVSNKETEHLREEIKTQQGSIQSLQERIRQLEQEREGYSTEKAQYLKDINTLSLQQKTQDTQALNQKTRVASLEESAVKAKGEIGRLTLLLSNEQKKSTGLEANLQKAKKTIDEQTTKLSSRTSTSTSTLLEERNKRQGAETELKLAHESNAKAESQLKELQRVSDERKAEIEAVVLREAKLREDFTRSARKVKDLEDALNAQNAASVSQLEQERKSASEKRAKLTKEKEATATQSRLTSAQNEQLSRKVQSLQSDLEANRSKLDDEKKRKIAAEDKLRDSEQSFYRKLEERNASHKVEVDRREAELQRLKGENEKQLREFERLQNLVQRPPGQSQNATGTGLQIPIPHRLSNKQKPSFHTMLRNSVAGTRDSPMEDVEDSRTPLPRTSIIPEANVQRPTPFQWVTMGNAQQHGLSLQTSDGDAVMHPPSPPPPSFTSRSGRSTPPRPSGVISTSIPPGVTSRSGRSTPPQPSGVTSTSTPSEVTRGRTTPPPMGRGSRLPPPPPGMYRSEAIDTRRTQTSTGPSQESRPLGQQTTEHTNPAPNRPTNTPSNTPGQSNSSSVPTNDPNAQVAAAVLSMAETIKGLVTQQQTFLQGFAQSVAHLGSPKPKEKLRGPSFRPEFKARARSPSQNTMMNIVCIEQQQRLGLDLDKDIANLDDVHLADLDEAEAFKHGTGPGPASLVPMKLDFESPFAKWNLAVAEMFLEEICKKYPALADNWKEDPKPALNHFCSRIATLKKALIKTVPKEGQDTATFKQTLATRDRMERQRKRRRERQSRLYELRLEDTAEAAKTDPLMQRVNESILDAGVDGMSSDESDTETPGIRVVHRPEWRKETFLNVVEAADDCRPKTNVYGGPRPGGQPAKRIRYAAPHKPISNQRVPMGKPVNFYQDVFLNSLSEQERRWLETGPARHYPWESDDVDPDLFERTVPQKYFVSIRNS